jgi:hypothetical protein
MLRIGLLGILLMFCASQAGQNLSMEIKMDSDNRYPATVVISGKADSQTWLGVSFYPYGTENLLSDGEHQVLELKAGKFEYSFVIPTSLLNGSVECATWSRLVKAEHCSGPCDWCKSNGQHLENRQVYLYGSLAVASGEEGK